MAKQSEKYDEETAKKVCGKLKAKFEGKTPTAEEINAEMKEIPTVTSQEEDRMTKELEQKVETLNKDISMKDEAIKEKDAKIAELQQKISEIEKEKAEADWLSMKEKLPVGMVHKPEDEAVLHKEYDENPKAFAKRILNMKIPEPPKKEGEEVVAEAVEFKKINSDWKGRGGF